MIIRQISAAGLTMITGFEALRLIAYQDQAGIWTIGYGHVPARKGQVITAAEADDLLNVDLQIAEMAVAVTAATSTDNQYAAMVSLCFNIGTAGFRSSTVLREHRAGNFAAAAQAFLMWDKITVDGKLIESKGLLNRRHTEMQMYLGKS